MNSWQTSAQRWIGHFCLALSLVLSLACTVSATQQRLRILEAIQTHGKPAVRVPQMLMCLHDRGVELPDLAVVILPAALALLQAPAHETVTSDYAYSISPQDFLISFRDLRGPPRLH